MIGSSQVQNLVKLKTNTVDSLVETLLSEAVFLSNSKVNKNTKLTPLQLVAGQQKGLPPKQETKERTALHTSTLRLSHLGMHGHETIEENSHEVKVHFKCMPDTLKTGTVGNQETSSPSSNSEKVELS